jgi:NAD-dependent SIR2 family protein deacetylase
MSKTIFIIGAGFSYDIGIPMQAELLPTILNYDLPEYLANERIKILAFIEHIYGLNSRSAEQLVLEDIYTPLHQSVSRKEYLKNYSTESLEEIENSLNLLISFVIDNGKRNFETTDQYVYQFINRLIADKINARTSDHFSILSLNWDIVLDKRLFEFIGNEGSIDYGCHCAGIDYDNRIIPSLIAKERGLYTIKLLKLHGSLNWVTCPKCHRLFINKIEKEGMKAFEGRVICPICDDVKLQAAILLPTFQKDFEKYHIQSIWNQASVELSEATKLVFMGYSFPLADYDFRSLITKHVDNVEVDVVLKTPNGREDEVGQRYRAYFDSKIDNIYCDGVADYIENNLAI